MAIDLARAGEVERRLAALGESAAHAPELAGYEQTTAGVQAYAIIDELRGLLGEGLPETVWAVFSRIETDIGIAHTAATPEGQTIAAQQCQQDLAQLRHELMGIVLAA